MTMKMWEEDLYFLAGLTSVMTWLAGLLVKLTPIPLSK